MDKDSALREISDYAEFIIKIEGVKSSIDALTLAKKRLFALKILKNVDSPTKKELISLKKIAGFFGAIPFIIGEQSNNGRLKDYVLFERLSILVGTLNTFIEYMRGESLPIKKPQEFYSIDGKRMKELREKKKLSLRELSLITGISKETLYRYENETILIGVENLRKLEKALNTTLRKQITPKVEINEWISSANPFSYLINLRKKYLIGKQMSTSSITKRYILIFEEISEKLEVPYFILSKRKSHYPFLLMSEFYSKKSKKEELLEFLENSST